MGDKWRQEFSEAYSHSSPEIAEGDSEAFDVAVGTITLKNGTSFTPSRKGVTALVGANNSGKSTILRELIRTLTAEYGNPGPYENVSVRSVELIKEGDPQDLVAWLADRYGTRTGIDGPEVRLHRDFSTHPLSIVSDWASGENKLRSYRDILICELDAEVRLWQQYATEQYDPLVDPPRNPLQHLQDNALLKERVSNVFLDAFGKPLTLDLLNNQIQLRLGTHPQPPPRLGEVSQEYREQMDSLPLLSDQGDGVRNFIGQLLPILTAAHPIIVIDEPEAYLHPPQAERLGEYLGELAMEYSSQVILATHDRNLLSGLLSTSAPVSTVLLTRGDNCPTGFQFSADELDDLWKDPLVRYTNILEGLFRKLVVLTESEGDCVFLRAALDSTDPKVSGFLPSDVLFLPTNGKTGMPKVAQTLTKIGVPVVAAPDLDILNDGTVIKTLVEANGHIWTDTLSEQLKQIQASVRSRSTYSTTISSVLDELEELHHEDRDRPFSPEVRKSWLRTIPTPNDYWRSVKKLGVSAFDGDALTTLQKFLSSVADCGVIPVHEGELECLAPEIDAKKGANWIAAAMRERAFENANTQEHIKRIMESARAARRAYHSL